MKTKHHSMDQPRHPAGSSEGGRWAPSDGIGAAMLDGAGIIHLGNKMIEIPFHKAGSDKKKIKGQRIEYREGTQEWDDRMKTWLRIRDQEPNNLASFLAMESLTNEFEKVRVYEDDDKVYGVIGYRLLDRLDPPLAKIETLASFETGMGRMMARELLDEFKTMGFKEVMLIPDEQAIPFWKQMGFVLTEKSSYPYVMKAWLDQ